MQSAVPIHNRAFMPAPMKCPAFSPAVGTNCKRRYHGHDAPAEKVDSTEHALFYSQFYREPHRVLIIPLLNNVTQFTIQPYVQFLLSDTSYKIVTLCVAEYETHGK